MTRDEAINTLANFKVYISGGGVVDKKANEAIDLAIATLVNLSSADRPQGEWIDADGNFVPLDKDGCTTAPAWCSNCGEWLTGSDEYCTSGRFCPHCGAKMEGEEGEKE